jgi:thiol-disulfide isomerase/thioredoxin
MKCCISRTLNLLILFLSVALFCQCSQKNSIVAFDINGKSNIVFFNDTKDAVRINFENWTIIPPKMHPVDTVVLPNKTLSLDFAIQGLDYTPILIDSVKYYLFTRPTSRDSLLIQQEAQGNQISYFGDSKEINEFIEGKANYFNSADADWLARAEATHGVDDFKEIININDSINLLHKNYLNENSENLQRWFIEFENVRLNYLNAGSKIGSLLYRKRYLGKEDKFEPGFFYNPVENIEINYPMLRGNVQYITFLDGYVGTIADSENRDIKPASNQEWRDYYQHRFNTINNELTASVKDLYLSFALCNIINSRRHILDTGWIDKITDESLNTFLKHQLSSNEVLPKGSRTPYFYLTDSSGTAYTPDDFRGKIVLINFWSTKCKPCITEFPYENNLVEKFKDDPVQIINVCMESKKDHWVRLIKKHNLKTLNLFSEGNWDFNLSKKFDISGWPHCVLIDAHGTVLKNNCRRASEGIEDIIDEALGKNSDTV